MRHKYTYKYVKLKSKGFFAAVMSNQLVDEETTNYVRDAVVMRLFSISEYIPFTSVVRDTVFGMFDNAAAGKNAFGILSITESDLLNAARPVYEKEIRESISPSQYESVRRYAAKKAAQIMKDFRKYAE